MIGLDCLRQSSQVRCRKRALTAKSLSRSCVATIIMVMVSYDKKIIRYKMKYDEILADQPFPRLLIGVEGLRGVEHCRDHLKVQNYAMRRR